jgi:hypothetical protein
MYFKSSLSFLPHQEANPARNQEHATEQGERQLCAVGRIASRGEADEQVVLCLAFAR